MSLRKSFFLSFFLRDSDPTWIAENSGSFDIRKGRSTLLSVHCIPGMLGGGEVVSRYSVEYERREVKSNEVERVRTGIKRVGK
jgi:hypothetical protein